MTFSYLLLGLVLDMASGHPWAGPLQTDVATSTANWSPATTRTTKSNDVALLELRGIFPPTVCGWIGGIVASPATCSTQSSCVWNMDNKYVGCCAVRSSKCKFYTSCIDGRSPLQDGDKDDVYTCKGSAICYQNSYPMGYKQWGCGAANWATFVATSYRGMGGPLDLVFTALGSDKAFVSPTQVTASNTINAPTTIYGLSNVFISETKSISTAAKISTSSTLVAKPPDIPSTTPTFTPTSTPGLQKHFKHGSVVGGVLGGAFFVLSILGCCLVGRRKGWFDRSSSPSEIQYQATPTDKPHVTETLPMPGTTHIDSNPVFELGNGDTSIVGSNGPGINRQAYQPYVSPDPSPLVSPSMSSPDTANGFSPRWGQRGIIVDGHGRPVSEIG